MYTEKQLSAAGVVAFSQFAPSVTAENDGGGGNVDRYGSFQFGKGNDRFEETEPLGVAIGRSQFDKERGPWECDMAAFSALKPDNSRCILWDRLYNVNNRLRFLFVCLLESRNIWIDAREAEIELKENTSRDYDLVKWLLNRIDSEVCYSQNTTFIWFQVDFRRIRI